jgi:hypothetical protein
MMFISGIGTCDGITPAIARNQARRNTEGLACVLFLTRSATGLMHPNDSGAAAAIRSTLPATGSAQWTRRAISAIFGVVIHFRNAGRAVIALALVGCLAAGCARRYAGPKALAAIGAVLLVGGGTTWVVGERRNQNGTANLGLVTTAIGVGAAIGAAGWLAVSVACEEDPDCPRGEECREVPALPGRVPYKQCMTRPAP